MDIFRDYESLKNEFCNQKGLSYLSVPDAGGDALSLSILSAETLEQQVTSSLTHRQTKKLL